MRNYGFKIFWSNDDNAFIATCPEFPGLSAHGGTEEEALREAKVALELFVEDMQESGETLPAPLLAHSYSGQFRLRLPRTLHRQLAERAEEEGVSLNSLAMTYLSSGVAAAQSRRTAPLLQVLMTEPSHAPFAITKPRSLALYSRFDRGGIEEQRGACEAINFFQAKNLDGVSVIEELATIS